MSKGQYRVKFVYDEDAEFEECNGENRPLTEEEYAENQYQGCPQHLRAGSKVIRKGYRRKGVHRPSVVGCAVCGNTKYEDIPYAEYLAYYGNPERHVYLGCVIEKQCGECQSWHAAGSLWRIDFMDNDRAYQSITVDHWYTPAQVKTELADYAREVATEVLEEAQP